ncbi:MAG: hypothetical protein EHM61_09040 [Acidobacteria bacterium]|nr:MAG: hypothetical protein EHM61_09040 [Acidobacteriota bacterium]
MVHVFCIAALISLQLTPRPISVREIDRSATRGVAAVEVNDYVFGGYAGDFPSPPHADLNPKKAIVVAWRDFPHRFVFSHEASYCPWFEMPSGAAVSCQMFEGNDGWAELFNEQGRKEQNSFVDIIDPGPDRAWVRWHYTGVNMESGDAAYRAVEDFWAFPNGLVLRRQVMHSLKPGKQVGYAREPIEQIVLCPVGKLWFDVLRQDPQTGENLAFVGLDPFSDVRIDIRWQKADPASFKDRVHEGKARRTGPPWRRLDDSAGAVIVTPLLDGSPFVIIGDASGFPHEQTRIKEHSDRPGTGGWGWGTLSWDHWPIGWLNSQSHEVDEQSFRLYPNHFAPSGIDLWQMPNEQVEGKDFYSLMGVGGDDLEAIRKTAKKWLEGGLGKTRDPENAARLDRVR